MCETGSESSLIEKTPRNSRGVFYARATRLELATSPVTGERSNQIELRPQMRDKMRITYSHFSRMPRVQASLTPAIKTKSSRKHLFCHSLSAGVDGRTWFLQNLYSFPIRPRQIKEKLFESSHPASSCRIPRHSCGCRREDSNLRPKRYECFALTT